jgi:hypothetical protein
VNGVDVSRLRRRGAYGGRPGGSALDGFRQHRRQALRREWRGWATIVGFMCAAVAGAIVLGGFPQLVCAGLAGATLTLALVGWGIGGDVYALTWLWGSLGEQQTAEVLAALDDQWTCEHDLQSTYGNWDHVLVGPPGVFLLDSKRLNGRVSVAGDALVSGRSRFAGGGFRGAARELKATLEPRLDWPEWVQSVVVVWGEFPSGYRRVNRVVYVRGDELVAWLRAQRPRLGQARRETLVDAVRRLRR